MDLPFKRSMNFAVGAVLSILSFVALPTWASSYVTKADVLADAAYLEKQLKLYHPNLNSHRPQKELNRLWKLAKKDLSDSVHILDAALVFQKIQASVCDEHTQVVLDERLIKKMWSNFLSESFAVSGDKLYFDNFEGTASPLISEINGISNTEIIAFLRSIDSADGCSRGKLLFSRYLGSQVPASIFLTKLFQKQKSSGAKFYTVAEPEKIKTKQMVIGSDPNSDLYATFLRQELLDEWGDPLVGGDSVRSVYRSKERMGIWRSFDKNSYYILIKDYQGEKAQRDFIDKNMRNIVRTKPKKIIIDVASNPGGRIRTAQRFMSYLLNKGTKFADTLKIRNNRWREPKNFVWVSAEREKDFKKHYRAARRFPKKGRMRSARYAKTTFGNPSHTPKMLVVVGPGTGSAGTLTAMVLKDLGKAKIIGKIRDIFPKTSCTSPAGHYILPKTRIQVAIPLSCHSRRIKRDSSLNSLNSDIPIDVAGANSIAVLTESLRLALETK